MQGSCGQESLLYKHCSCWICGTWVEVQFEVRPGDLKGSGAVCALSSIDNFRRPVPLSESQGVWRGSRFFPPTERCLLIFQVGEELDSTPRTPFAPGSLKRDALCIPN